MNKHIIIIEDDEDISATMTAMLTANDYKITCFNAFTDKDELAALDPDLFIIDERLPVISGHIISILLRSHPATRRVPQLLMSASSVLAKFADLGEVDASLKKPFEMDELLRLVENLLSKK